MISKNMAKALNQHLNNEFYSAYLYLGMSAKCESMGYRGAANWFYLQYQEETAHAMKFYRYILDQGEEVILEQINKPQVDYDKLIDIFKDTLDHERNVTQYINELVDLAISEKDHATNAFLQWFVTEQVEEEATVSEIIDQLKIVGDSGHAMLMIDKELAQRTNTPQQI
jgi:ferritin